MQVRDDGEQDVVAMCSRMLNKAKCNYQTFEKELAYGDNVVGKK